MQRVVISGAFAALAYSASAAVAARGAEDIKFLDQSWEELCEGSDWTIKWSAGNGKNTKVTIKGDDNWSQTIGGTYFTQFVGSHLIILQRARLAPASWTGL